MDTKTALQTAIHAIGGKSALARLLHVTPQAVQQWTIAPPERCIAIEEAASGLVTRYDLRPDVFGQKELV